MKQSEDEVRADQVTDQVTEEVSAPPIRTQGVVVKERVVDASAGAIEAASGVYMPAHQTHVTMAPKFAQAARAILRAAPEIVTGTPAEALTRPRWAITDCPTCGARVGIPCANKDGVPDGSIVGCLARLTCTPFGQHTHVTTSRGRFEPKD